jgi:hypothetical protein
MAETFSTKGLKALFSYPFRQPGWDGKLSILAGLFIAGYFVPVIPWLAAAGYTGELLRRAAASDGEPELPEWNDWGGYFVEGLRLFGVGVIAGIPLFLVFGCGFSAYFLSTFGMIASSSSGSDAGGLFLMGGWFVMMFSIFCGFALSIVIGIPLPAAIAHMLVKRSFSAAFHAGEWFKIFRANLGGFFIAFLLVWVIMVVVQATTQILVYTVILCALAFILPILSMPYVSVIGAYLVGKVYREGVETLALVGAPNEPVIEVDLLIESI